MSIQQRKQRCTTTLFISLLLLSLFIPVLMNLGKANPGILTFDADAGPSSPDSNTKPPTISVLAPKNYTVHATNIIALSINVSVGESSTANSKYIQEIYCKANWQTDNLTLYKIDNDPWTQDEAITQSSILALNLTDVPEGNHSLIVHVEERGTYYRYTDTSQDIFYRYYSHFEINDSSTVFFNVDTTSPNIAVLSPQNTISSPSDVKLSFVVNESNSRIAYSLDAQDNVTTSGNTTLTDLSIGEHTVKVYVWDTAGNVGASETVSFIVAESFPTSIVLAVSFAVMAIVVAISMLLYRRHQKNQPKNIVKKI